MATSTDNRPLRKFTPTPFTDVTINDSFWASRIKTNREQTIPLQYQICRDTGRIGAFKLDWQPGKPFAPHRFWDSDVAKWIEAASYSLTTHPDPALDALLDEVIALIASAQQPDGYLNTHFLTISKGKRWTNLRDDHELYCAGHMTEAAVAHFQATGKRSLLDVICRYIDHIDSVFGPEPGQKRGYCGHQEIELALVKLYHVTGYARYLKLSQFFIDERGRQPHYFDIEARARGEDPANFWAKTYEYNQSIVPTREQTKITGHAVRAMYFFSAMADLAGELGDESLLRTCERLWNDLTQKRMYLTGGIGPSQHNEGFTQDYDLPNETAYAETCAAIGLVFWNHRMLQLACDSRYADVMERALYNGVISGVALDGRTFFYENPLASLGTHHRQPWFDVACCPPNVARLLASLGQYIYAQNDTEIAVHLYIQGSGRFKISGRDISLSQQTNYPWDGAINIQFDLTDPTEFGLRLRIPGWCQKWQLKVNGLAVESRIERGYACLNRTWQSGDTITLVLDMPVEMVFAHPDVLVDEGHVALQRGPVVYCLETIDNPVPINRIALSEAAKFDVEFAPDLLGGVAVITSQAFTVDMADWGSTLYRTRPAKLAACQIKAVPYCVWDNRAPGQMRVWIPVQR